MRHLGNNWWDRHYRMICWMLVFLLLFLLLHAIGLRITPILRQTARLKATNLVTEQIERQVQESLQKSKGSFAKVERDGEGNILSDWMWSKQTACAQSWQLSWCSSSSR